MMVLSLIDPVLQLKLTLLAGSYIKVSEDLLKRRGAENLTLSRIVSRDNLYAHPWLFIRLSNVSRVRMVAVPGPAPFELYISEAGSDR